MGNEMMDVEQLATYLRRDVREVSKMASRGYLPGQKVAGQWRFARVEINHWIETQMQGYTEGELTALENAGPQGDQEPLLSTLLSPACVSVPLAATTRGSVLRELVRVAEQSWQVYDPDAILDAIRQREEMASTALPSGVAIPHPHRPLAAALGESLLTFGRTASAGVPFGSASGEMTDVFFLVCCRDDRTHLAVLARLSRLLLRPGFLDDLRAADTPQETWEVIYAAEQDLLAAS